MSTSRFAHAWMNVLQCQDFDISADSLCAIKPDCYSLASADLFSDKSTTSPDV